LALRGFLFIFAAEVEKIKGSMCTYNLVLDDQLVSEAESLLTNKGVTLQISARA